MNENSLNNLKPIQSVNEARIKGKAGGIKSGRSRRQRKAIREYLEDALNSDIIDKNSLSLVKKYFPDTPESEFNLLLLGIVKIVKDAVSDDTKPLERMRIWEFIRNSIGEQPIDKVEIDSQRAEELHIDKVLSERFTDDELVEMVRNIYMTEQTGGN